MASIDAKNEVPILHIGCLGKEIDAGVDRKYGLKTFVNNIPRIAGNSTSGTWRFILNTLGVAQ